MRKLILMLIAGLACLALGMVVGCGDNATISVKYLEKLYQEGKPFSVFQELQEKEFTSNADSFPVYLEILLLRTRISLMYREYWKVRERSPAKAPPSEEVKQWEDRITQVKEQLGLLTKANPEKSKEVDRFLVNGNFEGIRECVPYGDVVSEALVRVAREGIKSWEECKKYFSLLVNWEKGKWYESLDIPDWQKRCREDNWVCGRLFQGLAEFREPELILLLAQVLDTNRPNVRWVLLKMCSAIPLDSSEKAIDWYKTHQKKLVWQGARIVNTGLSWDIKTVERTFYVIRRIDEE